MQAFCKPRLFSVVASGSKVGYGDPAERDGRKAYSCGTPLVPRCSVQSSRDESCSSEAKTSKVSKITNKRRIQKENASSVDGKPHRGNHHRKTARDYFDEVPLFLKDDGGPPRWFSPLIAAPPERAPLMLFLPGLDGTGWGLLLHHESLGRFFELRCLHIPVHDRTSYIGLVKLVEEVVLEETKLRPSAPIYLVGDSIGSALALSVAARNPEVDLILILANPATSFPNSRLQPLVPLLGSLASDLFTAVPHILNFTLGISFLPSAIEDFI